MQEFVGELLVEVSEPRPWGSLQCIPFEGSLLIAVSEPRSRGSLLGIPLRGFLRPPRLVSHPHRLLSYGRPLIWILRAVVH